MTVPEPHLQQGSICVLVSGGVDSAVLVWRALQDGVEVQPVYVQAGMAWEGVERACLARYLEAIATPRLRPLHLLSLSLGDVYGSHWSVGGEGAPEYEAPDEAVYLPGRNIVLLSKTSIYCALNGIPRIALGVLSANPFPDATNEFFASIERSLSLGLDHPISIERPFASLHKVDVVRMGAHLPLDLTFSCIRPADGLHCGDCNKCRERQEGFLEAGVPDRTRYAKLRGVV
jgi:7-cyano-7-deazaguanine synthase